MIIYCATNKINNKKYIGQTIHSLHYRKRQHENCSRLKIKGGCRLFWRAIRKYGEDNFYWEILDECTTLEDLGEKESYYIQKYNTTDTTVGYNLKGGSYNPFLSQDTKKKIGDAQKGNKNHMYGKHGKDNPCSIIVFNETDCEYYDSATICSEKTGISISKICAVCRGERATTGNKVFRYVINGEIQYPKTNVKRKNKPIIHNKTGIIYNSIKEACISIYGKYTGHISWELKKIDGEFSYV